MGWRAHPQSASQVMLRRHAAQAAHRDGLRWSAFGWRSSIGFILMLGAATSAAQELTAPALKAAFVYQLPKFVEWPANTPAAGSAFSVCVVGDDSMADAFERIAKGHDYGGHRIVLSRLSASASMQSCQAVYVPQGTPRVDTLLAAIQDRPVLTISDMEGFGKLGGIVQLYFDRGKLRLSIDTTAANRAKLKISSRLLQLSKQP